MGFSEVFSQGHNIVVGTAIMKVVFSNQTVYSNKTRVKDDTAGDTYWTANRFEILNWKSISVKGYLLLMATVNKPEYGKKQMQLE